VDLVTTVPDFSRGGRDAQPALGLVRHSINSVRLNWPRD
jgi:hypothetical protein